MSAMFRTAFIRSTRSAVPRSARQYSAAAAPVENEFVAERQAIEHHAAKSAELWRKITFYVAFPSIILAYVNAKSLEKEHAHHAEQLKEENGGEPLERVAYPYLNIRTTDFPWGRDTLFHNPHVNMPAPE